ncbi:MAG: hypothetical protein HGA37_17715, partial [Lentimicrobium sp.]|nr:hypothetical protein [Lentimicrobium sp.]
PLLQETFANIEKLMPEVTAENQVKIQKISSLLQGRFEADYCRKVFNIVQAEYKILPGRNRVLLESRIMIHFNGQLTADEASKILNIIVFNLEEISDEHDILAGQVQANMGLGSGVSTGDEIENGSGRFGFDVNNPIPVNGIDMIDDYFSKLRLITGESISFKRLGSVSAENLPFPVDKYEINNTENQIIAILFVYAYHGSKSAKAPEGFRLIA